MRESIKTVRKKQQQRAQRVAVWKQLKFETEGFKQKEALFDDETQEVNENDARKKIKVEENDQKTANKKHKNKHTMK